MSILKIPKQSVGSAQMFQALARNMRALEYMARRYGLDETELDAVFTALGISRKFIAKTGLGNAVATYTGWTHVAAQGGFSIWKYAVTNFADSVSNLLWVENLNDEIHNLLPQIFEYQGVGGSELSTYFDSIFVYDGSDFSSNYGDSAGDLSVDGGAYQTLLSDTDDFLYIGDAATFSKVTFSLKQYGVGCTLKFEYYDASDGWTELSTTIDSLVDGTAAFTSDGNVSFVAPATWGEVEINSVTGYWIRVSTTVVPTQTPSAYAVMPGDSIITLLRLNNDAIRQEQWQWAYYNGHVYVTFPNAGAGAYEGINWINASSSAANKKNFFVYRNAVYTRYLDSTFVSVSAIWSKSGASTFNGTTGVIITHNLGHTNYHVSLCSTERPVAAPRADFLSWVVKDSNTVTIYCSANVTTGFTYRITTY
jgi:hypothetical protein